MVLCLALFFQKTRTRSQNSKILITIKYSIFSQILTKDIYKNDTKRSSIAQTLFSVLSFNNAKTDSFLGKSRSFSLSRTLFSFKKSLVFWDFYLIIGETLNMGLVKNLFLRFVWFVGGWLSFFFFLAVGLLGFYVLVLFYVLSVLLFLNMFKGFIFLEFKLFALVSNLVRTLDTCCKLRYEKLQIGIYYFFE